MLGPKKKLTVFQRQFFRVYLFGFVVYPLVTTFGVKKYIHILYTSRLWEFASSTTTRSSIHLGMQFFWREFLLNHHGLFQSPCAVVKSCCSTPVFRFFFSGGELCLMKPNLHPGLLDRDCDAWCNIWARGALDIAEILQIHQVMQGVSCHCRAQFVENNTKLKSLIMDSSAGGSFSEYRFPPF